MPWFQKLCRSTGLALHGVMHPAGNTCEEVRRTVEEEKVSDTVTLRRTTIEEVEITPALGRPASPGTSAKDHSADAP